MGTLLLVILLVLNLVLLILVATLLRRTSSSRQATEITELAQQSATLHESLSQRFNVATADMAMRLESTKGDLSQQIAARLGDGFAGIRNVVEEQVVSYG